MSELRYPPSFWWSSPRTIGPFAFDAIGHTVLFDIRHICLLCFGFINFIKILKSQCIHIDGMISEYAKSVCGVLQGSVLGPLFFLLYLYSLGFILLHHGIDYNIYADDTQLHILFELSDLSIALDKINLCISHLTVTSQTTPHYLCDLIVSYANSCNLRANDNLLIAPSKS